MDKKLRVRMAEARERLSRQITKGEHILRAGPPTPERLATIMRDRSAWRDANRQVLYGLFTSGEVAEQHVSLSENTWLRPPSCEEEIAFWMGSIRYEIAQLHRVMQDLEGDGPPDEGRVGLRADAGRVPRIAEVLVLHDGFGAEGVEVVSFLRGCGVKVTLVRQSDTASVMERLDEAVDALAVILLGADPSQGTTPAGEERGDLSSGALLCLCYSLGRLGESRVLVLTDGGVEVPVDTPGVRCVPLASERAWKSILSTELGGGASEGY